MSRARTKAGAWAVMLALALYACYVYIAPGWLTYGLTVIPCLVLIITVIAHVNDLVVDVSSAAWNVHRHGLILTAIFALIVLLGPPFTHRWPTWPVVYGLWGFALVWLVHQPPWLRYVWGSPSIPVAPGEAVTAKGQDA